MPKTKELPDSLKLLVRRQAVEVRHTHFGHDAEALVARMGGAPKPGRWSIWKIASGAAVTVLLLSGWGCYELVQFVMTPERNLQQRREAGQQSLDTVKAGEHQAPAGQAAAKPKAEQAEQQQLGGALRTEGGRPELRARTDALLEQGNDASDAGDYNRAIATYTEGIRLDPGFMLLFYSRGNAYAKMKDYDRAIADYSEAIRLDPNYVPALTNRGMVYWSKGLYDRAIVDYDEVIRINPNVAFACRGLAYAKKK